MSTNGSRAGSAAMALVLSLAACGPPPAAEAPRPLGVDSRAFVGESELRVRYRYVPRPRFGLALWVDLTAQGGDAGEIEVEVDPGGFEVIRGPLRWRRSVGDGSTESERVLLRAGREPVYTVRVTTRRVRGQVELARDTLHFIVDESEDRVRECRPTDAACNE